MVLKFGGIAREIEYTHCTSQALVCGVRLSLCYSAIRWVDMEREQVGVSRYLTQFIRGFINCSRMRDIQSRTTLLTWNFHSITSNGCGVVLSKYLGGIISIPGRP